MPRPDEPPAAPGDALVESSYDDGERTVLLRFLRLSPGDEFQLAAVEVPTPAVRAALLAWLRSRVPDRPAVEVSLKALPEGSVIDALRASPGFAGRGARAVLALTDLEETRGASTEAHPAVFMRLNLERDLWARGLPLTCLLLAHPAALLKLRLIAPDFCHYLSTLVRWRGEPWSLGELGRSVPNDLSPSGSLELSQSDWPALLRAADQSLARGESLQARDQLAEFRATPGTAGWDVETSLLEALIVRATQGTSAGLAALERVDWGGELRVETRVRGLLLRSAFARSLGERERAAAWLAQADAAAEVAARRDLRAPVLFARAEELRNDGDTDAAIAALTSARALFLAVGRTREAWWSRYRATALRWQKGEWESALAVCRAELIPEASEALRDPRLAAFGKGLLANILLARGDLDESLRLRREELAVYERLGDERSRAITLGQIATVLYLRGELDEALRLRREELAVCERLGGLRWLAAIKGRIAEILHARGELDEALRLRHEEVLPVYERLGDERGRAITLGKIADVMQARGDLDRALRLRREGVLPICERLGDLSLRAAARAKTGELLAAQGRYPEALRLLEDARADVDRLAFPLDGITVRRVLALAHWRAGDRPAALREAEAAFEVAAAQREPAWLRPAAALWTTLLRDAGRVDEARAVDERAAALLAPGDAATPP